MNALRLVWELARKDLLLFAADRRGMLLCFGMPIVLASAFGAIFHRKDDCPTAPRVHVVGGDDTPIGRRIVEALCSNEHLEARRCDRESAKRRLASETSSVVVLLPAELKLSLAQFTSAKDRLRIEVWHPPQGHWEARWVEGVLAEVLLRESAREVLTPLLGGKAAGNLDRPFEIARCSESAGGALSANAYSHAFCGMTLQYLLFWGMDSGLLLLRERRQGIWRRLRAAPVSRFSLLAGKALATAIVALAQIAVTFAFGRVVFGVTVTGSIAGFGLMAVAAALLSATTGLLVAAVGGNEGRARSVAILTILTLSLLGGLWLPAFLLPAWAQSLAWALPTTWAARGLEGVTWQGMPFAGAWPCACALVGYSGVFLGVAWWRLVRTEGGGACPA